MQLYLQKKIYNDSYEIKLTICYL